MDRRFEVLVAKRDQLERNLTYSIPADHPDRKRLEKQLDRLQKKIEEY